MCGIAGVFTKQNAVDRAQLDQMAKALHHRGPDDSGIYIDNYCGLVHTRLSIIDLETGHQPLTCDFSDLVLIANGEIYNAPELRPVLEKKGRHFKTNSDCEVILHAYAVYGPQEFLKHIEGMFAFALYDKQNKTLILARDPIGMKPLFFAKTKIGYAFASELKALLPFMPAKTINPANLAQYLQNQFSSGRQTIIEGIDRVLPGECVTFRDGDIISKTRYWSIEDINPTKLTMSQAQEQFDELMETVIQQHMRSDVPFGLFLSGGIDSSLLLSCLHRFHDRPIRTFSVGYPNSGVKNELPIAEKLARHFGCEHTVLEPTVEDSFHRLPQVVWAADELMCDTANLPTALLAEAAGQDLKVIFSGEGGDEAFAGYGRYRSHPIQRGLKKLLYPQGGGFRTRGTFQGKSSDHLFGSVLSEQKAYSRQAFIDAWKSAPKQWNDLQKRQYVDISTELADDLLVKADRILMAHGIEGRLPYCDRRIVEFGLSLPDDLKVKKRTGKYFLREWAKRYVPADVLTLKKRGFSVPVQKFLNGETIQHLIKVLPEHIAIKQWFQPEGVKLLLQQQESGKFNHTAMIWSILQFALWHDMFITGDGSRPDLLADPMAML